MKKTMLILTVVASLAGTLALATETNKVAVSTNVTVIPYPLDYCLISGDKIGGDMGKPVVTNYDGQEIKFCCPHCVKDFKKNPQKYMKALQEAEKQGQKK